MSDPRDPEGRPEDKPEDETEDQLEDQLEGEPEDGPEDKPEGEPEDNPEGEPEDEPRGGQGPVVATTSEIEAVRMDHPAGTDDEAAAKPAGEADHDRSPPQDPPPPSSPGGAGIAWFALLIAIGAACVSGYLWSLNRDRTAPVIAEAGPDWKAQIDAVATASERALGEQVDQTNGRLERLAGTADEARETADAALGAANAVRETAEEALGVANAAGATADQARQAASATRETANAAQEAAGAARQAANRATRTAEAAVADAASSGQRLAGIEGELQSAIRTLDQRFDSIQEAVSTMAETRKSSEGSLLIAEAEFLVRVAGERLELFGDPATSIRALELAQSHLEVVDDPLYAGVRRTLAGEIEMLRSIDLPDLAQLSGRLRQLAETSVNWPLDDRRTLDRSANVLQPDRDDSGWWSRLRAVVSGVAVVHRDTGDGTLLLTLDEEQLLRENVRLQLQIAQLACIRGDDELYRSTLDTASRWLESYYDLTSPVVAAALDDIGTLAAVEVAPEVPDLGDTLRALRRARAVVETAEESP